LGDDLPVPLSFRLWGGWVSGPVSQIRLCHERLGVTKVKEIIVGDWKGLPLATVHRHSAVRRHGAGCGSYEVIKLQWAGLQHEQQQQQQQQRAE